MSGALKGLRVVEMQGLGPTPFAAMWLADMGADVVRIQRPGLKPLFGLAHDVLNRGREVVELDLKTETGRAGARALIERAEILIEGMRPGVMERLGLGPETFAARNPGLVYGRMTGWGQTGPLAQSAGHDITYLALTGALHAIGPEEAPAVPLNLIGDFGGGAMYLVSGLLAALLAARATGKGQVVDCAITDGAAHLMAMIYGMKAAGLWQDRRQANLLDGAAPYYTTYACACGGHMAVGALEPQFYDELVRRLGLDPTTLPDRDDRANWPALRAAFASRFASRTRDAWAAALEGTDACAAPVLSLSEAPVHAHNRARGSFEAIDGVTQPAAAPVLAATPGKAGSSAPSAPLSLEAALSRWQQAGA